MALGVLAHHARIDARLSQFGTVADQPTFDLAGVGFQMKLQAQHRIAERKSLWRAARSDAAVTEEAAGNAAAPVR